MTHESRDVPVVPFSFTDENASKRRPAAVVSSIAFNRTHRALILAMITTSAGPIWSSNVELNNWKVTGLAAPRRTRFRLSTLDNELVPRRIGSHTRRDALAVRTSLTGWMGAELPDENPQFRSREAIG